MKRQRLEEQLNLENKTKLLEIQHKTTRTNNIATELEEARKFLLPADFEENSQTYLLRVLLLIANKVITASWLKPNPPTITQWRERIQDVYNMEYTALLQLKADIFLNKWSFIALHFHLI